MTLDFSIGQDMLGPKKGEDQEPVKDQDDRAHSALLLREEIEDKRQDREQRKEFAIKIYHLTCFWLVVLAIIILFQGLSIKFGAEDKGFHLSDTVLVAVISGASVNILGLMAIVIRYLFPSKK